MTQQQPAHTQPPCPSPDVIGQFPDSIILIGRKYNFTIILCSYKKSLKTPPMSSPLKRRIVMSLDYLLPVANRLGLCKRGVPRIRVRQSVLTGYTGIRGKGTRSNHVDQCAQDCHSLYPTPPPPYREPPTRSASQFYTRASAPHSFTLALQRHTVLHSRFSAKRLL